MITTVYCAIRSDYNNRITKMFDWLDQNNIVYRHKTSQNMPGYDACVEFESNQQEELVAFRLIFAKDIAYDKVSE